MLSRGKRYLSFFVFFCFQALDEDSDEHCTVYVKVHVPFEVLCLYAEELNMRAPLQVTNLLRNHSGEPPPHTHTPKKLK